MESPVVVDKPPEYHGNERGFPFEDEDASGAGAGAWSELAARHPDIAARLRQRPSTWGRKRRPSSQDAQDFGDGFSGFDRFPFEDIPPEFREHFPSRWNRRFSSRDEQPQHPQPSHQQPQPSHQQPQPSHQPQQNQPPQQPQAQQQTAATQTEPHIPEPEPHQSIPQYGLRNTVDLGQKSAVDPSVVDAEERNQRSMSAPPDSRANMSSQGHPQESQQHPQHPSNVRVIPIMVEGRDEPVINRNVDHGTHFGDSKPTHAPPQPHSQPQPQPHPQPHIDRDQYFNDDGPISYSTPPNFSRSFGTPFNKFRQGPQPFVQQKVYPQSATAFARGASPQRSQSPKPPQPQHEEHFVKVPVHHEHSAPKAEPQARQQPKPQQQPHQPPPQQPQPQAPPPPPKPAANDPITQILAIQTDVLNLMSDVENFKGAKKDKSYIYLDEMLTRNLIKLDNIETDGKENIRQARKEAIRCIQKCIAVLEAKAGEGTAALAKAEAEAQEIEIKDSNEEKAAENGEVEMAEPKAVAVEGQPEQPKEEKPAEVPANEEAAPPAVDTRPEEKPAEAPVENKDNVETKEKVDKKGSPKKGAKNVKKRDKSKDKDAAKDKQEIKKEESMQVDDKASSQTMEVDAPSQ